MTGSVWAVAGGACSNIGVGNSVFEYVFPRGYKFLRSTP